MPTLDVQGCSLNYAVEGPEGAPALVLSNSISSNLSMWDGQVPAFAARFRVVRYDTRGHGASSATPAPYSMERLGRDVLALLDHLGIARARYCGLSLGGMTGMWLGAHAPDRFERLALCNTTAHMTDPAIWNGRIRTVRDKGIEAIVEGTMERWFTPEFRQQNPETIDRMRGVVRGTAQEGYCGCASAIRDMDFRESNRSITTPTLVVVGSRDQATPPRMGELVADSIPDARLVALDAAHISNIEQPEAFARAVLEFLA